MLTSPRVPWDPAGRPPQERKGARREKAEVKGPPLLGQGTGAGWGLRTRAAVPAQPSPTRLRARPALLSLGWAGSGPPFTLHVSRPARSTSLGPSNVCSRPRSWGSALSLNLGLFPGGMGRGAPSRGVVGRRKGAHLAKCWDRPTHRGLGAWEVRVLLPAVESREISTPSHPPA